MPWFRRRPKSTDAHAADDAAPTGDASTPAATDHGLVAVPSAEALARTEHALVLLASQSAQLQTTVIRLENRVDVLSGAMLERLDAASNAELVDARIETAKVAAEVSRLEINLAARVAAVRDELRALGLGRGDHDTEIDLRHLDPTDTGWTTKRTQPTA